ncbi:bacteriocin immunity protein [Nonomuraea sp. B19D2]|uniref:bacteriocin immunity protein n=1 Tax=Nonomuraea sp. B19D2 TaxID=3159561 RepID=UPI0032DA9F82
MKPSQDRSAQALARALIAGDFCCPPLCQLSCPPAWTSSFPLTQDLEELARDAARPERPKVSDITREELAEIVRRIMEANPDSDYYLRLLEANVLHPRVSDLIFWPPEELQDATAEEIVEAALRYRPIAL